MIKKLWEKIKGWFTPRKEEPIILSEPKPEHCSRHLRFRKSCPSCQAVVA
jgi:hypothetical protein|tara:strand:+ start:182 stop:331 length:150 start_codon:yes stop_codon:yes gene_type:complete